MKREYLEDCPAYLNEFLTHLKVVKNRGDRTIEAYYIDIRTFLRYLKHIHKDVELTNTHWEDIKIKDVPLKYVADFSLLDAYDYLTWLADERKNSVRTRSRKSSALKQFYIYLCDKKGLIEKNPLMKLEMPKLDNTLPKYLSLEDAQKLLNSIDSDQYERDYCMITLFLNCGMRLAELCALSMNDISFENRTLRLWGKGNKERIVYMNDACVDALNDYLEVRNAVQTNDKALFLTRRGTRISRRRTQEIVEESLKKAGLSNLGITTHKLRHTAATLMYQHGNVDPLVLKEVLGHKSIATTEIYVHLSDANRRNAANSHPLANVKNHHKKKDEE